MAKRSTESKEVILTIESPDNLMLKTTARKPACKVCLPRHLHSAGNKRKKKCFNERAFFSDIRVPKVLKEKRAML